MSDSHESRHIDPKIKGIMKWQLRLIFINFFLAIFAGWALGQLFIDPEAHPVWFGLASGVAAALLIRLFNFISLVFLQVWFYGANVDSLVNDADHAVHVMNNTRPPPIESAPNVEQLEFRVIKKARKPLGRFMDHDFYEWIEIVRDGAPLRLYFEGTLDMKKATVKDIPPDCLVLPPGIIYKAKA